MKTNESSVPCALCGQPSVVLGQFVPRGVNQILFGAPAGKTRHIFYGLCLLCASCWPDNIPEIEQAALRECAGYSWN